MSFRFRKRLLLYVMLSTGWLAVLTGQNLVPNYSFETYNTCPLTFGANGPTATPPWIGPTMGSPDIFNACSTTDITDVPDSFFGEQDAITGDGYAGGYCKLPTYEYREYIQAPLLSPLVAGQWYYVSFFVSPGEYGCPVKNIGAYLSATPPSSNGTAALNVTPQIESNGDFINDYENWTLISGCFFAVGGEAYITIGNFHDDSDTPVDPNCGSDLAYYFFEDISVVEGDAPANLPLELDGPVYECFSYEIDPDISEYNLIWEDGSHGPTMTVTETGVYSLTITDGCNYGLDSIEVIINGNFDPIDLGPDEVTICNGEVYEVSLDPDLSDYTWHDGSHDPEYSMSTSGIYAVTLDDGCAESVDEIEIVVVYPPDPISLGEDLILCSGDEIDYMFDSSLGDFTWQDNTTLPSYIVSEGGTYAVTVSNMCGEVSDEVVISDLEVPEPELGPDEQNMCNGDILEFEIDQELGDILWQDGSSEANYEITTGGLYTLYVSNECGTGIDQVVVTVIDPPTVDLGPDLDVCGNEIVTLTTAAVNGTYEWQDNSNNDSLVVTSSGIYALTITNFCGEVWDDIVIDYTALLSPFDFGPDVNLCPGEELILHANHQSGAYQWQDGSTSDTLLVNSTGTYYAVLSNACNSVTDTINVSVNNSPPIVDLPAQLNLCQGQSIMLDAGIGGINYLWNDNSQNQQLLVASPGAYSLTVSNACGSDRDTVIILDGGPAPVVDLGIDIQICPGDHEWIVPSFSNVDSWLWHDGSEMASFDASNAGLITVAVSNACGSSFDTLLVGLLPSAPPLDLGPDTSLCSWQSFALSIQTPGVSILWPDGSTDPDFTVIGPGEVAASISNTCGTSFDTLVIDAKPEIPTLDLGADQSLCPGEIINVSPGILNVNYEWQDGSINNSYQSTQEESIILIISNECGSTTDTLEVIESTQGPQLNLGTDIQECEGVIVTIPSGVSGVNYLWQDGSTDPDIITTQSGVYILQVSNNCGADIDTINVDISGISPTVTLGPDTTLCEGSTLLLVSDADAITSIQWQNGSSSSSFAVSSPGIFSLAESNRCGDASDTIVVYYLDAPDPFTLGPDTTLCPGETITLTAPTSTLNIQWQDGSILESIVADQPITYSLQLSNDCGSVSDELVLSYDTQVPFLDLGPELEWCEGDIITLDASQLFNASYSWNNSSVSSSIEISAPGVYSVEVSTACSLISDEVNVVPGIDCYTPELHKEFYIPNVFSPNGDGINDVFVIGMGSDLDVQSMQGSVFDRWGNLVFSSEANPFSWDGRFIEKDAMPAVYVLVLHWEYNDGGVLRTDSAHRDITLLR